jgi:hypothetical protein
MAIERRFTAPMLKRLRAVIESIAFAGLKRGNRTTAATPMKPPGPLRGPIERLLAGGPAPSDPLYLSNRTLGQKARAVSLIAVPCLALALGIAVLLSKLLAPPEAAPDRELTAAEMAAQVPPNEATDSKAEPAKDIEVLEVGIQRDVNPRLLAGKVRNNTNHEIAAADFVFDVQDSAGSQLGAVRATIERIAPASVKAFQFPIRQQQAAFALVRDMSIR